MSLYTLKARNALTLKKVEVNVKAARNNPNFSVRKLVDLFDGERTQINTILKNKESTVELFEMNAASESIRSRKRSRPCEFYDVNEALHGWYLLACRASSKAKV